MDENYKQLLVTSAIERQNREEKMTLSEGKSMWLGKRGEGSQGAMGAKLLVAWGGNTIRQPPAKSPSPRV